MLKFSNLRGRAARCEKLQLAFIRSLAFHSIRMLIYSFWIKDTLRLPLCDEIRANGENRRGSAIDLGAVQAAFGTVHLHSTEPRWQQLSKSLRPLLLSIPSHLSDILEIRVTIEAYSNADRDWKYRIPFRIYSCNEFYTICLKSTLFITKIRFKDRYFYSNASDILMKKYEHVCNFIILLLIYRISI